VSDTQEQEARLREIREREAGATPGPWKDDVSEYGMLRVDLRGEGRKTGYADVIFLADMEVSDGQDHRNAEFIAHSRADIPWLLALVDRQREALRWIMSASDTNVGLPYSLATTFQMLDGIHKQAKQSIGGQDQDRRAGDGGQTVVGQGEDA
jgi:hypothetical protein